MPSRKAWSLGTSRETEASIFCRSLFQGINLVNHPCFYFFSFLRKALKCLIWICLITAFAASLSMSSPATLKYPSVLGLSPVSQDFVLKLSALYNKILVFFMLFCFLAKSVASPCSCASCAASFHSEPVSSLAYWLYPHGQLWNYRAKRGRSMFYSVTLAIWGREVNLGVHVSTHKAFLTDISYALLSAIIPSDSSLPRKPRSWGLQPKHYLDGDMWSQRWLGPLVETSLGFNFLSILIQEFL